MSDNLSCPFGSIIITLLSASLSSILTIIHLPTLDPIRCVPHPHHTAHPLPHSVAIFDIMSTPATTLRKIVVLGFRAVGKCRHQRELVSVNRDLLSESRVKMNERNPPTIAASLLHKREREMSDMCVPGGRENT